ncbi:acid phosphatase [Mycolicibacterium moriokaense]|uniref:Acid phosphatase n=1 Tax=Mycolicibacterium moriokaense TaxID=39691 RepID=A0AAD1HA86_9MYCO|nr:HAD family hydrolase [Mycolicibacterium moriokaense]MCV7041327.1 haloacid dehalogenase-like hydrolase [Mycolicibacterium moriokaense]ORB14922.1 acid phosphatase [Mycolicibacterium moriokaense]BBX00894.1 acid phosphatase [Mycolicibacterium moriokaense]
MLESWVGGPTKSAIIDFVGRVTSEGPHFVAPEHRVAVFDNDGTLWCEKPMYIQLDFIVRRLAEKAASDRSLAAQPPYQAAAAGDLHWFGGAITKHYQGDDTDLKVLVQAVMSLHESMSVEDHAALVAAFFAEAKHPTLGRPYPECVYVPMVELLRYLEDHGFTCYIVSGGGRDFMRPITGEIYGIPPERVVGSAQGLKFDGAEGHGDLLIQPALDIFDDGPEKPVRVWSRIGRRPILSAGNSNGDDEMLQYCGRPRAAALRMLVLHDDAEREFDYTAGAERVLEHAAAYGWTVVSMKNDWATVFGV